MTGYERVCTITAVRRGYNAGQSVPELAKLAGKSTTTIRRWLKISGLRKVRNIKCS